MKQYNDSCIYPGSEKFPERAGNWQRICRCVNESVKNVYTATKVFSLPPSFLSEKPFTIGFVSDIHYTNSPKCRAILNEIISGLKSRNCDLLLLGGDICADSEHLKYLPEILEKLSSCAGACFAAPGNWERGKIWLPLTYWEKLYARYNIEFLINRQISFGGITVTGVDDTGCGFPEIPRKFTPDKFNILLAHRPDTVIYLDCNDALANCSMALCGHTHAGQIRAVRGLLPASKYGWRFDYGFFRQKKYDTLMYVTSGAGELSFPFRINCSRELVFFQSPGKQLQ